tara:strand:- start:1599 stop:2798 length:1200 start_codon:yes stop_codon:yes gene_type:complete
MATPKLPKGKLPTESDYKDLPTEKMMEIILNTFTTEELIESTNMDPFIYASFQKEDSSPDGAGGESTISSISKSKSQSSVKTPSSAKKYIMKFNKKKCLKGKGSKYTIGRMREALIKVGLINQVEQFKTFPPKAEFNNLCALISSVKKRMEGRTPGSSISWKSRKSGASPPKTKKPSPKKTVETMKAKIEKKKAQAKKQASRSRSKSSSKSSSKSRIKVLAAAEAYLKEVFSLVKSCESVTKATLKENVMKRTKLSKEKVKKHLDTETVVALYSKFCKKASKSSSVSSSSLPSKTSSSKASKSSKSSKASKASKASKVSSVKKVESPKKAAPAPVKRRKGSPSPVKVMMAKKEIKAAGGISQIKGEKLKTMARTLGAVQAGKKVEIIRTNIMAILNKYR